jgi:hypothetical protein
MIDLSDEKKSLGVISVTCVTKTLLIRLLDQGRKCASGASQETRTDVSGW